MKTKIRNGIKYELKNGRWTRPPEECKYCGEVKKISSKGMCANCYQRWHHHIKCWTIPGYEEEWNDKRRKYYDDHKEEMREYYRNYAKEHPGYRFEKIKIGFLCGHCGKVIKGFVAGIPSKKHDLKCPFCRTRFKYNELKKVKFDRITWEIVEVLE